MKDGSEAGMGQSDTREQKQKSVRFTAVVQAAGKPQVYLPLFDPKQDRTFMRAVKENCVLSSYQEPTSTRSDYGVVGVDPKQRYTALLVFPKSLAAFNDARVIGIKYEMVAESRLTPSRAPKLPKPKLKRANSYPKRAQKPTRELRREPAKHAEPQPKEFRVRVRITTVTEKDVTVTAMTQGEARKRAEDALSTEGHVRALRVH